MIAIVVAKGNRCELAKIPISTHAIVALYYLTDTRIDSFVSMTVGKST